jgi:hypothetical protein
VVECAGCDRYVVESIEVKRTNAGCRCLRDWHRAVRRSKDQADRRIHHSCCNQLGPPLTSNW